MRQFVFSMPVDILSNNGKIDNLKSTIGVGI
jgi:hypothetical protein